MTEEEEIKELLEDLYQVGKTKSVGYLPLEELIDFCGVSIDEMAAFAKKNHLHYRVFEEGEASVATGAIFLYDTNKLAPILSRYQEALKIAGVPYENPHDFIRYIAKYRVDHQKHPAAYEAVAKSFNDNRFR